MPDGKVALTLDVEGAKRVTSMLDARDLEPLLAAMASLSTMRTRSYHDLVRFIVAELPGLSGGEDEAKFRALVGIGLWTALSHPAGGDRMRKEISTFVHERGSAHVTWHFGNDGFAVSICGQFSDLRSVTAWAPKGRITVYGAPDGGPHMSSH